MWVLPAPRKKQGIPASDAHSFFPSGDDETALYDEIEALKAREDATILAHYYQDGE